jgi:iron complex outermembrane receptor protein
MSSYLRSTIHTALLATALGTGVASAAEPQQTTFIEEIEVIVVTGSYIEGAAEDAALPIDVLRAEDLAKQGSPSMVELIKQIPAVQGVVGESNQFTAPNTSGTANINLRGLGGVRTLVLMNGRRLVPSPAGTIGYDVNLLPTAAMGRIEVLKDGAAATYGSDAVAGVVNFITKRGYEGLNLEGSYNYVEGSDGDYSANLLWGTKGEDWDLLVAGGYRHRSELSATDRDFAIRPSTENPNGGLSVAGNPGTYSVVSNTGAVTPLRDPGCEALGNFATGTSGCTFQFTNFDNLVESEDHYNVYTEFNKLFGESTELHVEAMYAVHNTPEENSSPSYAPTVGAALATAADGSRILTAPTFAVPLNNPGFAAIRDILDDTPAGQALLANAAGLRVSGLSWRPFGAGGNPLTGEGKQDERNFDAYRVSTSLRGETSAFNWDVGVTFMETTREIITPDIVTTRLQAALNGFGGPNCTGATPGANGCLWLNPFSSAAQMNPATGAVNNLTYDPSAVNTAELASWLFQNNQYEDTASTFVVDAVLNGQLPFGFPAGDIGWAAGVQYREETLERDPNDLTDITKNPCVDSLSSGNMDCAVQSGVFSFLGPFAPLDLTRDIKAVFTELNVPVLESLSAQVAVRYEDYGSPTGSTTNPKLSLRWQALDWLTFRGSVGTTFRGPQQTQLAGTSATTLALISAVGQYKTFDVVGDPNLEPEEAFTFNVGSIVKAGGFTASLDYWSYDFEKSLENESGGEMISAFFRATPDGFPNGCNDPAYAGLRDRFQFTGTCSLATLQRVTTRVINGPDQKLSGLDGSVSYLFDDVFMGADILVGADATYTLEYKRDASFVEGILVQAAGDFAGTRGASGLGAGSLPELRGATYVDVGNEMQGLRLTARYIDGVKDIRSSIDRTVPQGLEVGSFLTYDAVYRLSLPQETTITASVINFTDRDPPLTRLDLSYDPFLANPYGRYFKLLLNKKF